MAQNKSGLVGSGQVIGAIAIGLFSLEAINPLPLLASSTEVRMTLDSQSSVVNELNVPNVPNVPNSIERARKLYESGRFLESVELLLGAASSFEASEDVVGRAIALSNLSLALQQLGRWQEAAEAIAASLAAINTTDLEAGNIAGTREMNEPQKILVVAGVLETQGKLQLATGQLQEAIETWQQASKLYHSVSLAEGLAGKIRSEINRAGAMQALGLYRQALKTLTQVEASLQDQPDSSLKATGLLSLGKAELALGNLEESREILEESERIARGVGDARGRSAALLSLGNTARARQNAEAALGFYREAAIASADSLTRLQAQLNELGLLVEIEPGNTNVSELLPQIESALAGLPPSRQRITARINFAQSLMNLAIAGEGWTDKLSGKHQYFDARTVCTENFSSIGCASSTIDAEAVDSDGLTSKPSLENSAARQLALAVQEARSLQDRRAESYAIGQLGKLYEGSGQYREALELTESAARVAEEINAADIAYQWQWQLGRVLKAQNNIEGAIAAYSEAVNTLQSLRGELTAVNPDVQFSFRETVEPVYRQFVALLLQEQEPSQKNLQQAREAIESLQLAELDNFFQDACLDAQPQQIEEFDPAAATIYPIMVGDAIEVILSLPGKPLRHYSTSSGSTSSGSTSSGSTTSEAVSSTVAKMRQSLRRTSFEQERLPVAQKIYNWLIRPAEEDLAASGIETLVFVLDGELRNLPMAALHDGERYLIEKYGVVLTPGLQLLPSQKLAPEKLSILTAALGQARQGFPAIPGVIEEISQIQEEFPAEVLLDAEFTNKSLQEQIAAVPFPVVHLATHGQFSSKAEETFILTWDNKIKVADLHDLLSARRSWESNPIELFVLSACETAAGDDRAALGLAGIAVRSGARSTLATLWQVNDDSTALFMAQFYRELAKQPAPSKAEALRRAQLALLEQSPYRHPYFWAPFVLVGNWQ